MAKKLKSVLKNQKLRLALEALIFVLLLTWAKTSGFSPFPVVLFLLGTIFFYLRGLTGTKRLFVSFVALLILSFITPDIAPIFVLGFIFYLIEGIRNVTFLHRETSYYLNHILLVLLSFFNFFLGNLPLVLIFFGGFFIFREFLTLLTRASPKEKTLISLALSLLVTQGAWVVTLLPLSIFASSALMILFVFILNDFIVSYLEKKLTKQVTLRNITIFIILLLIIFGISQVTA